MVDYKEIINNGNENEFRELLSKLENNKSIHQVAIYIIKLDKINMMRILLNDCNVDTDWSDMQLMADYSIIEYCANYGTADMLELILDYSNTNLSTYNNIILQDAMNSACQKGNYSLAKIFLMNGFDPNTGQSECLILAIINGNLNIVKMLIEYDANVTCQNNLALYNAIKYRHYDITRLLLQNGADINAVNRRFCSQQDNTVKKYIDLLIENDIDVSSWISYLICNNNLMKNEISTLKKINHK